MEETMPHASSSIEATIHLLASAWLRLVLGALV